MRKRKDARRLALAWVAAIAIFALATWLLLANVVFVVRDVAVEGAGEVPEADVRRLSGIRLGMRMSSIDEAQVLLDVESDGRIAYVGIEKRWPSRVVLHVRPRSRDAMFFQGGKIVVLDADGYVVEVIDGLPDGQAVYVSGLKPQYYTLGRQLDDSDGRRSAMSAVINALKSQGAMAYASELNVNSVSDLRIVARSGVSVLLGDRSDMEDKIAWMAAALSDLEARGEISGQLDVSSGSKADFMPERAAPAGDGEADAGEEPEEAPAS